MAAMVGRRRVVIQMDTNLPRRRLGRGEEEEGTEGLLTLFRRVG